MWKKEYILVVVFFIAVGVPLVLWGISNTLINKVENLEEPEALEIESVDELYKLDSYKDDLTIFIYFSVFDRLFHAVSGNTVLNWLYTVRNLLTGILLVEGLITIGGGILYYKS